MDETPDSERSDPETLTSGDTDSTAGWMSLREAEAVTGVKVRTLRAWYGQGKIDSRMEFGPHGRQRVVRVDQVERIRGETHPARPTTTEAVLPGRVATAPEGAMLVPLSAWQAMMEQLGNLHEAGQQLADARADAARFEEKYGFELERRQRLEGRVAELEAAQAPAPKTDHLPDIDDDVVARLAAEVEELRAHRPPAPWWRRVQIQIPRRGPRGSKD